MTTDELCTDCGRPKWQHTPVEDFPCGSRSSNPAGPDGFTLDGLIANAERSGIIAAAEVPAVLRALRELRDRSAGETKACNCGCKVADGHHWQCPLYRPDEKTKASPDPVARVVRAAVAFVDAIDTDQQIDVVSKQAMGEWVELADAVIMGRHALDVSVTQESP